MLRAATLEEAVRQLYTLYHREDLLAEDVSRSDGKNYCIDIDARVRCLRLWDARFVDGGHSYLVRGQSYALLFGQMKKSLLQRHSIQSIEHKELFPDILKLGLRQGSDEVLRKYPNLLFHFRSDGAQVLHDIDHLKLFFDQYAECHLPHILMFAHLLKPLETRISYECTEDEQPAVSHTLKPLAVDVGMPVHITARLAEFLCYSTHHIKSTDGTTSTIIREKEQLLCLEDVDLIVETAEDTHYPHLHESYLSLDEKRESLVLLLNGQRKRTLWEHCLLTLPLVPVIYRPLLTWQYRRAEQQLASYQNQMRTRKKILSAEILLKEPLLKVQFYGKKSDLSVLPSRKDQEIFAELL